MNKVYIIGRLTHDPDLKYYGDEDNQKSYLRFSIAVNKKRSNGERYTDFIDIVAFNKKAEILSQYIKKGNRLSIQGHLSSTSYLDSSENRIYKTDVILENFEFMDNKQSAQA